MAMIIEKIIGDINTIDAIDKEGFKIDFVILSHDQLQKSHQRVKTTGGKELGISLARGEYLFCGAILYSDDKEIIAVDMPKEKVFEIKPNSNMDWAKAAFNIGNMHQSAYLYPDRIRIPYDYVLENMLNVMGIPYSIAEEKLDGIRPNVASGNVHHHSHLNTKQEPG